MALMVGLVDTLDMVEGGGVPVVGLTGLGGGGAGICGEALALVLGAPTTSVVGAASLSLLCPYY